MLLPATTFASDAPVCNNVLNSQTLLQCYSLLKSHCSRKPSLASPNIQYILQYHVFNASFNYSFIYMILRLIFVCPSDVSYKRRNIFSSGAGGGGNVCVHTYFLFTRHSWLTFTRSFKDICSMNEFFLSFHAASKKKSEQMLIIIYVLKSNYIQSLICTGPIYLKQTTFQKIGIIPKYYDTH